MQQDDDQHPEEQLAQVAYSCYCSCMPGIRPPITPEQFWARGLRLENGCLIWPGANNAGPKGANGYGIIQRYKKRMYVHRWAYVLVYGPIGDNLTIDHTCETPSCYEPTHLEAVPHSVNNARSGGARVNRQETHCPHGHEYNEKNTYIDRMGKRFCRACRNKSTKAWADRNKERMRDYQREWHLKNRVKC